MKSTAITPNHTKKYFTNVTVHIYKTAIQVGKAGAELICRTIKKNEYAHICCATGKTPILMYQTLSKLYQNKLFNTRNSLWSHLDERAGIDPDDKDSYVFEISKFWNAIGVPIDKRFTIKGNGNPEQTINELKMFLAKNQRDVTILGIGEDGHIAFNMPGDPDWKRAHYVKRLSDHVISRDAERTGRVLTRGITMGIHDIIESKSILMLATGDKKAHAVKCMLYDNITPAFPASYVRRSKRAIILLDSSAAKYIK